MTAQPALAAKTQEVEVRAVIGQEEGPALIEKLKARGATDAGRSYLRDVYFCPKRFMQLEEVAMNEVGSYSFRLRQSIKDGHEELTLNSKTITQHGDHSAWEEHEVAVAGSFDEAWLLLTRTEFKPFFDLKKHRHMFVLGEVSINIEDIEDFGYSIETELMTTVEEQEDAKATLRALLAELGIGADRIAVKSVTSLVMKQRAKF